MELAGLHEKLYKAEVGLREALGRRDAAHEAVQALEGQVAALQEEERLVVARLQPQPAGGGASLLLAAVWADQESEDGEELVRHWPPIRGWPEVQPDALRHSRGA